MPKKGQIDLALLDKFQTQNQYFGDLDVYDFHPVAEEKIILACSKEYYAKSIKKDHSLKNLIHQKFITYNSYHPVQMAAKIFRNFIIDRRYHFVVREIGTYDYRTQRQ